MKKSSLKTLLGRPGGRDRSSLEAASTDGRRVARVEKEVSHIISTFIIQKIQSELPGFVTVGRVQIPADLRQARVYVSLMNLKEADVQMTPEHLKKTLKILQSWASEMQTEISHRVQMKYVPKITFFADESTEKILKIENILANLSPNERHKLDDDIDLEDDLQDDSEDNPRSGPNDDNED